LLPGFAIIKGSAPGHYRIFTFFWMAPQNKLEHNGNLGTHPFAELVAEIAHARVTGSLRVSNKERKCVVYFKIGRVAFAVSNSRSSRLFEILLRRNRIHNDDLTQIPNFANDLELADLLVDTAFLTKEERDHLFIEQIEGILVDILAWTEGEWNFNTLARLRDGLSYEIDFEALLVEYARCLMIETVLKRFRSLDEAFVRADKTKVNFSLNPNEINVLSKFRDDRATIRELVSLTELPEAITIRTLYALWLGGLVERKDWNPAFSDVNIANMREAKLELRKEAKLKTVVGPVPATEKPKPEPVQAEDETITEIRMTLEEYLTRVEGAETFYDVLGVDHKAELIEIRHAYFSLAKMFHPDHYHQEGGEVLRRVQNAFTELAQAHETLKRTDSREIYDFKMRSELAAKDEAKAKGSTVEHSGHIQQAADNFNRGHSLLMDNDYEAATPFLARAAHFDPKAARYHAYYGKALSADDKQRHKAEAEMQAAVRLDPDNPTYRIILAEFFIQQNLLKRAEGELNRLLAVFPNNREARDLLASLNK
jgi:tetratricopeptide (TPR) repeat protein